MDLETLTNQYRGTRVRILTSRTGEVKTIESFGYKASGDDLNRTLINFTDGTWDWAENTEPVQS